MEEQFLDLAAFPISQPYVSRQQTRRVWQGVFRHFLTPAQLRLTPTPALVVGAQGGITLGPERGELGADF